MDKDLLKKVSEVYPLNVRPYEQYIDDTDNTSSIEKINAMIQNLHHIGRLTNEVIVNWNMVMKWLVDSGIEDITSDILTEKLNVALNTELRVLTENLTNEKITELIGSGQFESIIELAINSMHNNIQSALTEFNQRLTETAKKSEVRLKSENIGLNDADTELLSAIQNKEGETTFNLLSVPRFESVDPVKTTYLKTGKNLFNAKKVMFGYSLGNAGGAAELANYCLSDYIPVQTGDVLTISGARNFAQYDLNKEYKTDSFVNNPGNAPATITIDTDGYLRASLTTSRLAEFQIEKGSTTTSFEPYQLKIEDLSFTEEQKNALTPKVDTDTTDMLTVNKNGETFNISSEFDGSNILTISTTRSGSANGTFNFLNTKLNDSVFHVTSDDITPIRTFTTVGANHGYGCISRITLAEHGKTTSDFGSIWTDGNYNFTLLDIIGDYLYFGCPYSESNGIVSATKRNPDGSLTHVSGATNTASISATNQASVPQLYPSVNNVSVKYILDGKEITSDGEFAGKDLIVEERYNIMDYKDIIDYAQSNIGKSYKNDTIKGVVQFSIKYHFKQGGKCSVSHTFKPLRKFSVANCGFMQSVSLVLANHTTRRYMPNVKEKNGIDFKEMVDLTSYNSSLFFGVSDYMSESKPPDRHVDWLFNGDTKKAGFTMGYIIDKTNSKDSDRLLNTSTGWDMRGTKKSYPVALSGQTFDVGDYKTFQFYRNYLAPSEVNEATNINIVKDERDVYIYLDFHENALAKSIPLDDYIGKKITILDSGDFDLLNDTVDSDGITFNIKNGYGFAVLKLN